MTITTIGEMKMKMLSILVALLAALLGLGLQNAAAESQVSVAPDSGAYNFYVLEDRLTGAEQLWQWGSAPLAFTVDPAWAAKWSGMYIVSIAEPDDLLAAAAALMPSCGCYTMRFVAFSEPG